MREFNARYAEAEGAMLGQFPPSPKRYGGTGRGKFFDHEEKLECDLILIDSTQKKEAYHD